MGKSYSYWEEDWLVEDKVTGGGLTGGGGGGDASWVALAWIRLGPGNTIEESVGF